MTAPKLITPAKIPEDIVDAFPSRLGFPERRRKIATFLNTPIVQEWLRLLLDQPPHKEHP